MTGEEMERATWAMSKTMIQASRIIRVPATVCESYPGPSVRRKREVFVHALVLDKHCCAVVRDSVDRSHGTDNSGGHQEPDRYAQVVRSGSADIAK